MSQWPSWLNKLTALPFIVCQPLSWQGEPMQRICAPERALCCVRQRGSNEECIGSTIPTATGISPGWSWLHRFRATSWTEGKHNISSWACANTFTAPAENSSVRKKCYYSLYSRRNSDCYRWQMSWGKIPPPHLDSLREFTCRALCKRFNSWTTDWLFSEVVLF